VSPGNGSTFAFGDTVAVEVEASLGGQGELSVEFYVGGTWWHTDKEEPFQYVLDGIPYRTGGHTISAVAVADQEARAADSVEVSIVSGSTPTYGVRVVAEYPHDEGAFTQGFVVEDGVFYEGTGQYGRSSIRQVEIETGTVLRIREIPSQYWGEGITIIGSLLYQLTWRSGVGFVYHVADFDSLDSFSYSGEGWGLTTDGTGLIMSDGSHEISFLDPNTFAVTRTMEVTSDGTPITLLNELEYVEGDLFANRWRITETRIARISLESGAVVGWINLGDIAVGHQSEGVLNGIAYDPITRGLYITGKNWDKVYKIELTH
jgi:glutamine cyclotransferase